MCIRNQGQAQLDSEFQPGLYETLTTTPPPKNQKTKRKEGMEKDEEEGWLKKGFWSLSFYFSSGLCDCVT